MNRDSDIEQREIDRRIVELLKVNMPLRGISKDRLAKELTISGSAVSEIFNDRRHLRIADLRRIWDLLGFQHEYLPNILWPHGHQRPRRTASKPPGR